MSPYRNGLFCGVVDILASGHTLRAATEDSMKISACSLHAAIALWLRTLIHQALTYDRACDFFPTHCCMVYSLYLYIVTCPYGRLRVFTRRQLIRP
jgi:hypothetical protein